MTLRLSLLACVLSIYSLAQQPVLIRVDGAEKSSVVPAWNYFGYDEPNYSYAENGRKLINELTALSDLPIHIRTHNLLTTGDGTSGLKWGSTNAYTEDRSGKPVYDWTIVDRILDTYLQAHVKPFVEIGFMPEALSTHPEPYRHHFPNGDVFTGWSYPPRDYAKWAELVYQWAKHCGEKYGKREAESWDWEVWNEPDIPYWHGSPEDYDKLYDHAVAAVKRALPRASVGGPASTGPANPKAAAFLEQFLRHCESGRNFATAAQGSPLDFIAFHAKGRPVVANGMVQMGLAQELKDAAEGFRIVHASSKFRDLPIVLSEADPEGCAACSARTHPQNAYRNGPLYAVYEAVAWKSMLDLAKQQHVNLAGILTWAFEFEGQPYFAGFRTLATNGVDKPVLNFFRMAGLMRGAMANVQSSRALKPDEIISTGVVGREDVDAIASVSDRRMTVMVWNYRDEDTAGPAAPIDLQATNLASVKTYAQLRHFRIDGTHSNSFAAWKEMGSPQHPSTEQYRRLEASAKLQLLEAPRRLEISRHSVELKFSLPSQALSLLELSW